MDERAGSRWSYVRFATGQVRRLARPLRKPHGRVVLAGEHTDDFLGYLEGAVRSGLRAGLSGRGSADEVTGEVDEHVGPRLELSHTRPVAANLTVTALATARPGTKLRFEASGRGWSHGNTVRNPPLSAPATVTFSAAADVRCGMSGRHRRRSRRSAGADPPIQPPTPKRVSRNREGTTVDELQSRSVRTRPTGRRGSVSSAGRHEADGAVLR